MIAVTGANGYVGGRILAHLRAGGSEAVGLVREPESCEAPARPYALGAPLANEVLEDVDAVVHAAWDTSARGRLAHTVNVEGSLPLLGGIAARGGRMLLISSLSAFAGARSDYGRAKYALEQEVLERGGVAVRPGLVFGAGAGGLFGAMVQTISGRALMPIVGASERLFLAHDERLCELAAALLAGPFEPAGPVFAAHERPTTLGAIAAEIAAAQGRRVRLIPIAPGAVYAALRCAEALGLSLPYRSDSVRSLASPVGLDELSTLARGPVRFPALRPDLWIG